MAAENFIYCYDCNIFINLDKYPFNIFPRDNNNEMAYRLQFIQDNIIKFLYEHKGHKIWLGDDGEEEWISISQLQKVKRLGEKAPYLIRSRLDSAIKKHGRAKSANDLEWVGYHQGVMDICREIIGIMDGDEYKGEKKK